MESGILTRQLVLIKEVLLKILQEGEGKESALPTDIKVLKRKKMFEIFFRIIHTPRDICNVLLQSVQIRQP